MTKIGSQWFINSWKVDGGGKLVGRPILGLGCTSIYTPPPPVCARTPSLCSPKSQGSKGLGEGERLRPGGPCVPALGDGEVGFPRYWPRKSRSMAS